MPCSQKRCWFKSERSPPPRSRRASAVSTLPRLQSAAHDTEQRMRQRARDAAKTPVVSRATLLQLTQQMLPFEVQLAVRTGKPGGCANWTDFAAVKCITSRLGFGQNPGQITIDGRARRGLLQEALQLRVVPVSLRLAAQHGSREKTFPPQRNQTLRVQIFWMQCPDAHQRPTMVRPMRAAFPRDQTLSGVRSRNGNRIVEHADFPPPVEVEGALPRDLAALLPHYAALQLQFHIRECRVPRRTRLLPP